MTFATIETENDYDAVAALLHRVLDAVNEIFRDADIDLPDRQYINAGAVAYDCEQVTVQLIQIYLGTPSTPPGTPSHCSGARSAVMRVNVLRKAPTFGTRGQTPPADKLSAAAESYCRDMWLLLAVPARVNDMHGSILAEVDPIDTEGGYSGAGLNLTMVIP